MDADEEDCIFFGTPIGREEDTSARKRKAASDAGALRALPAWKQEVRDDEGRRRFHGAFTGGFSAGYYNTAGSKEGWTPQTFTSSRKNRGEVKQQSIYNFLDEDEREEFGGHALETSSKFDTFGFTAAELSRKEAIKDQKKRPSIIPGPVPDEIVLPAANSVGIKLLLRMGWRHGRSISDARTSLYDSRREARKAFLAFSGNKETQSEYHEPQFEISGEDLEHEINVSQNIPVYVLNPKQNLHGLGYDPFKHAPEFRERKRLHSSRTSDVGPVSKASRKGNLFSLNSGKIAPGFGIGALEELDIEDEDIYDYGMSQGFEITETCEDEIEPPPSVKKDVKPLSLGKESAVLTGFKVATSSDYTLERFQPPNIPRGFELHHKFSAPLDASIRSMDSPPPEVAPPDDNNLRLLIEGFATLVSRCGQLFEDLSREKNKSNPLFCFLNGGKGHNYYSRKLWEEQQKRVDQKRMLVDLNSRSSVQKMTVETRGRALGEKPLMKSSNSSTSIVSASEVNVQSNLSDNFTKTSSHFEISEIGKPFEKDPAKQQRFEQFLKDKFEGGLRSVSFSGTKSWSENDRARERLDFEAALEVVKKGKSDGKQNEISLQLITDATRFVSGGTEITGQPQKEEQRSTKDYPKREEFQWRPAPILCKRFDIMDPFMGKPPPMPRAKSKMDSFIFASDFVKSEKIEETAVAVKGSSLSSDLNETAETIAITELKPDLNHKNVHKPVDLYKAIFSDDSEDDDEDENKKQSGTQEKKSDVANTTLNRLVAGDFLESLGKELGLDIPSEAAPPPTNVHVHKEVDVGEDPKITPDYDKLASTSKTALSTEHISKSGKTVVSTLGDDDSDYAKNLGGDRKTISPARDRSRNAGHGTTKTEKEPTYFQSTGNRTQTHHQGSSSSSDTDSSPDQSSHKRRRHSNKKDKKAHSSKREKTRSKHHHGGTSSHRHSSRDDGHSDSESSSDGKIHGGSHHKSRSSKKEGRSHSRHHRHRHRKSSTSPDTEADYHCSRDRHGRITSGSHERSSISGGHRKHY